MVPFLDLKTQYQSLKPDIQSAINDVLDSGHFVLGPAVDRFERSFAETYGLAHAVACSSGTAALHLALLAYGIGRGDEVITTPMTFIATATAIDLVGAKPVLVDVEADTGLIDASRIAEKITPRTKAIMPVHLYGQCVDMETVLDVATANKLIVIEDAAQAHGAKFDGRFAGNMGEIAGFSFYPGKNLGAYGEGGLVATGNAEIAKKLRMLRDWGQEKKYHHVLKGLNYRMDGVQGAVLDVKMRHVEAWTEQRRRVAGWYAAALAGIPDLRLPVERPGRRHVWHVYSVQVSPEHRGAIMAALGEAGIGCNLHYPVPVHLQPCFAELGHRVGDFPAAECVANSQLSLPMYPEMTETQVAEVAEALRSATAKVAA